MGPASCAARDHLSGAEGSSRQPAASHAGRSLRDTCYSSVARVCCNDNQQLVQLVRLDDDFPPAAVASRQDHPASRNDILSIVGRRFKHNPQIELGEATISHSLEGVWAELEVPVLPLGPTMLYQLDLLSARRLPDTRQAAPEPPLAVAFVT